MDANALSRSQLLYGADGLARLAQARVIVFGVGGVGSWCAEGLARSGVGHITLVDADCVDVTNINRQLPAEPATVGLPKAEVMAERLRRLMPGIEVQAVRRFYDEETAESFGIGAYDVVIDAIDSLASKAHLILSACATPGLALYSSMGAARRTDPGRVQAGEFWRVRGCPLARALRDRFKRQSTFPARKFACVFSDEPPQGEPKGTSMPVTATFGLRLASLAVNGLIQTTLTHHK